MRNEPLGDIEYLYQTTVQGIFISIWKDVEMLECFGFFEFDGALHFTNAYDNDSLVVDYAVAWLKELLAGADGN